MTKLGTAIGGLLLISALAAPVAFAHYDTGAHPVPYATTGLDVFGADDNQCNNQTAVGAPVPEPYRGFVGPNCGPGGVDDGEGNLINPSEDGDDRASPNGDVDESVFAEDKDRVSGWYYGSTNTYTELRYSPDIDNPLEDVDCSLLQNATLIAVCEALTDSPLNPGFLFAQWSGLYDMEVLGLGDCDVTNLINEERVDGKASGGVVPDGIFNDGGHGAVGHTFGHYDCPDYETSGCDDYNQAWAEDLVSGEDIWIGAMCSWGTPVDGETVGIVDILNEFVGDIINCPLGGFPQSCIDAVQYLDDCLGLFLLAPNDTNCGVGAETTIVCGAGSVADIDFGRGQGSDGPSAAAATDDGAWYPNAGTDDDGVNCDSVATASAFPFTAVIVSFNGGLVVEEVSVATYGWVA